MDRFPDECVLSGIIFINRNGLRWCDAPKEYGPAKTLYNRWKRWSDNGVFARIMVGLAAESAEHKTIMIDATYLKAQALSGALQGGGGGGGIFGTLFSAVLGGLGVPGFAGGGQHAGGLRIVGENGPELEATGPSTIIPADLTRRILSGGAPATSTTQIDARPVINITNHSSVPVQGEVRETTDSSGKRRFDLVMADAVAKGLTAGGGQARRTMRNYYGVSPVGIARG